MRADNQNPTGISSSQPVRTPETEAVNRQGPAGASSGPPSGPAGPAGEDQVHLSDLAGRLRSLSSDTPERAAYLEKLSGEVEAGRYTVDALALSRKIIDDALQGNDILAKSKGAG
jgi:anti-sigma28 factor (negative regulator of flagellin synthesis)